MYLHRMIEKKKKKHLQYFHKIECFSCLTLKNGIYLFTKKSQKMIITKFVK